MKTAFIWVAVAILVVATLTWTCDLIIHKYIHHSHSSVIITARVQGNLGAWEYTLSDSNITYSKYLLQVGDTVDRVLITTPWSAKVKFIVHP